MLPLFAETRRKAMREKRSIVADVMMADDSIVTIRFGPRGGWKILSTTYQGIANAMAAQWGDNQ